MYMSVAVLCFSAMSFNDSELCRFVFVTVYNFLFGLREEQPSCPGKVPKSLFTVNTEAPNVFL